MPRRLLREPHVLAHELRTPLCLLAGWMSLIRDGDLAPEKCPETWASAMEACQLAVDRLNLVIAEACDEATLWKRRSSSEFSHVLELLDQTRAAVDHSREVMDRILSRRQLERSTPVEAAEQGVVAST